MAFFLLVTFSDGSVWEVDGDVVIRSRATHYADREYGGDVELSIADDTLPLFEEDPGELSDWAGNNMDWDDLAPSARLVQLPPTITERDRIREFGQTAMTKVDIRDKPTPAVAATSDDARDAALWRRAVAEGVIPADVVARLTA